ncbi:hypothetical protein X741_32330 [Mesorhizobium sp. LNHC229A00]|nr:hypothetical protein X741_32330 [Mesorhizobium sp. LNHC229A00]
MSPASSFFLLSRPRVFRWCQVPKTDEGDQVIGPATQFLPDVIDQEVDAAAFSDGAGQRFAADRFAGRENRRLDAVHPFAPARFRRQVIQLAVKQAVA